MKSITAIIHEAVTAAPAYNKDTAAEYAELSEKIAELVQDPDNPVTADVLREIEAIKSSVVKDEIYDNFHIYLNSVISLLTTLIGSDWASYPGITANLKDLVRSNMESSTAFKQMFPDLYRWTASLTKQDLALLGTTIPGFEITTASRAAAMMSQDVLDRANQYWKIESPKLCATNNLSPSAVQAARPSNEVLLEAIEGSLRRLGLMQIGFLAGAQHLDKTNRKIYNKDYKQITAAVYAGLKTAASSPDYEDILNCKDDTFKAGVMRSGEIDTEGVLDDENDPVDQRASTVSPVEDSDVGALYNLDHNLSEAIGPAGVGQGLSLQTGEVLTKTLTSGLVDAAAGKKLVELYGQAIKDDAPDFAGFVKLRDIDNELFMEAFVKLARTKQAGSVFDVDSSDVTTDSGAAFNTTFADDSATDALSLAQKEQRRAARQAAADNKGLASSLEKINDYDSVFKSLASNQAMGIAVGKYINTLIHDPSLSLKAAITFMGQNYPEGTPVLKLISDMSEWRIADDTPDDEDGPMVDINAISSNSGSFLNLNLMALLGELLRASSSVPSLTSALAKFFTQDTDRDVRNILIPTPGAKVSLRSDKTKAMAQSSGLDPYAKAVLAAVNNLGGAQLFSDVQEELMAGNNLEATIKLLQHVYRNYSTLSTGQKRVLTAAAMASQGQTSDIRAVAQFLLMPARKETYELASEFVKNEQLIAKMVPELPTLNGPLDLVQKLVDLGRDGFNRWLSNMIDLCAKDPRVQGNASLRKAATLMSRFAKSFGTILTESILTNAGSDLSFTPDGAEGLSDEDLKVKTFVGANRVKLAEAAAIMQIPIKELEERLVLFAQFVSCRFILLPNALRKGVQSPSVSPGTITGVINPVVEDFITLTKSQAFNPSTFAEFRNKVLGAVKANNMAALKTLSNDFFNKLGITPETLKSARVQNARVHYYKDIEGQSDLEL